jgi:plasmid stabilization system protein ParE
MNGSLVLRRRAEEDLTAAALWYEEQLPGLGREFLDEADRAILQIAHFPDSFPARHRHFRRALLRRFPYGIFYAVEPDLIVVLTVIHLAQDPAELPRRLD